MPNESISQIMIRQVAEGAQSPTEVVQEAVGMNRDAANALVQLHALERDLLEATGATWRTDPDLERLPKLSSVIVEQLAVFIDTWVEDRPAMRLQRMARDARSAVYKEVKSIDPAGKDFHEMSSFLHTAAQHARGAADSLRNADYRDLCKRVKLLCLQLERFYVALGAKQTAVCVQSIGIGMGDEAGSSQWPSWWPQNEEP